MSVPSELLLNTQNSFQTHAQRGANIVMRGGKRKSRRKKGGVDTPAFLKGVAKRVSYRGKKKRGQECTRTTLYGSQCEKGYYCKKYGQDDDEYDTTGWSGKGKCTKAPKWNDLVDMEGNVVGSHYGGKRKSKRTKRMARKSRRKSRKNQRGGRGRTITFSTLDHMANSRLGKMVPHGEPYTNCNKQSGGGFGFTREGAADAATFKGSYPAFQKYEKSKQCGGKRRRRRKSRKKRRKSRKKSRKSRRKRRRSRRRRRRRGGQRGGSSASYAAPFAGGEKPWATAPLGIQKNGASCYDNYNHYKGM